MNRATSYVLILLGFPLGYVASYFCQAGAFKAIVSLGDYVSKAGDLLSDIANGKASAGNPLTHSVTTTAITGLVLGPILMGVMTMVLSRKKE